MYEVENAPYALLSGNREHFDTNHNVMTIDTMTYLKTCFIVKIKRSTSKVKIIKLLIKLWASS